MGMKSLRPRSWGFAAQIRHRIESGGERLWRQEDFTGMPATAIAQHLSRLCRTGELTRLSKGIYYRPRQTPWGPSRPEPMALQRLAEAQAPLFPAGLAAANRLGFTTQSPRHREIATTAGSLPRKLLGENTLIHTHRPAAWSTLREEDAALLDFLRRGGRLSELSPQETVKRILTMLAESGTLKRLLIVAQTEPPRVRAMLGALGERLGRHPQALRQLKQSLNPLSRFDFGPLSVLPNAAKWLAKPSL